MQRMKRLKLFLCLTLSMFFMVLYAKEDSQDFSQTKISWDGPPQYDFRLLECEGSTYTSTVRLKFAIKHNLAHQYVTIGNKGAYDRNENSYYVNLYGYKSMLGYSYYSSIERIIKTETEAIVEAKVVLKRKIDSFDTVKLEFYITKPYYYRGICNLEFINLPIEWKFLNF